jgi:general stress protein YciG
MAGTRKGSLKTARKNHKYDYLYAAEGGFYAHIGKLGGAKSHGGSFADQEFASRMGKIGGAISRRYKVKQ